MRVRRGGGHNDAFQRRQRSGPRRTQHAKLDGSSATGDSTRSVVVQKVSRLRTATSGMRGAEESASHKLRAAMTSPGSAAFDSRAQAVRTGSPDSEEARKRRDVAAGDGTATTAGLRVSLARNFGKPGAAGSAWEVEGAARGGQGGGTRFAVATDGVQPVEVDDVPESQRALHRAAERAAGGDERNCREESLLGVRRRARAPVEAGVTGGVDGRMDAGRRSAWLCARGSRKQGADKDRGRPRLRS